MSFWSDIHFSLRQLRKRPGFTCTVLATLALCNGVNTAIFSVIDAALLRQLPYPDPERLGELVFQIRSPHGQYLKFNVDGAVWEVVHRNATAMDTAAIGGGSGVNLASHNHVEYVQQSRVSAGYFHVLGVAPQIGREFSEAEDRPGGPAAAVLSYGLWQKLFGKDPKAVGHTVYLRGEPFTIVGVMPASFVTRYPADLWTPLRPSTSGEGAGTNYGVFARLKPRVSWVAANSQLTSIEPLVIAGRLTAWQAPRGVTAHMQLISLQRGLTESLRTSLLPKWGAAFLILLIGCVNVAGLLLAQSASRRREIATRMAIGASRGRVISQLLTESVLLALAGGLIGMAVAALTLDGFRHLGMEGFHTWRPVTLDARVLSIAILASLATSLVFGLIPAFDTTRFDIRAVLLEGSRGSVGKGQRRLRQLLVAGEIALGLVLLVSAGLLIRTLEHLQHLEPGFDPHHVLVAQLSLQDARYATDASVDALFEKSLTRIRALPGVESAAVGLSLPYQRPLNTGIQIEDGPDRATDLGAVDTIFVTATYFETLRMPVLRGRSFIESDNAAGQPVAVVNQAFVGRFLRHSAPLNTHVGLDSKPTAIVGIVSDAPQQTGAMDFAPPLSTTPTVYVPYSQAGDGGLLMIHTWFSPNWIVRTRAADPNLPREMERVIESIDPLLPYSNFTSMEELHDTSLNSQRYSATLFSIFAGLALLLAAVGIYGLIANSVSQRTREIGIRMALGANVRDAIASILRPGMAMVGAGIAAGLMLTWFATGLLRSLVWGVPARDPETFLAAIALMLVISFVASLLPALRLTKLDPAQTLRNE